MQDIVIVSAARTAVGKFGGSIANIAATDLGAIVIREAIARARLDPAQVGEIAQQKLLTLCATTDRSRWALNAAVLIDNTTRS